MPDTDKFVSALATNGHILDKSKTDPFKKTRHGFVYNILTCQDIVDRFVYNILTCQDVVDKSVSVLASNGQICSMEFDYSIDKSTTFINNQQVAAQHFVAG